MSAMGTMPIGAAPQLPPPVNQQKKRSLLWLWITLAVVLSLALVGGVMALVVWRGMARPATVQVVAEDFSTQPDEPKVVDGDLAWELSGGLLKLSTASNDFEDLNWDIPPTSTVRVEAAFEVAEQYANEDTMWGVTFIDEEGHAVLSYLCQGQGSPVLVNFGEDQRVSDVLAVDEDYTCGASTALSLEVSSPTSGQSTIRFASGENPEALLFDGDNDGTVGGVDISVSANADHKVVVGVRSFNAYGGYSGDQPAPFAGQR